MNINIRKCKTCTLEEIPAGDIFAIEEYNGYRNELFVKSNVKYHSAYECISLRNGNVVNFRYLQAVRKVEEIAVRFEGVIE